MKKFLIAVGLVAFLGGCAGTNPVGHQQTENPDFSPQLLGTIDNCRVWRHFDSPHWIYFVTCPGGQAVWNEKSGKSTVLRRVDTR
jgi:hypothetical protein